jgi:hypothetical protein
VIDMASKYCNGELIHHDPKLLYPDNARKMCIVERNKRMDHNQKRFDGPRLGTTPGREGPDQKSREEGTYQAVNLPRLFA